MTTWKRPNEVKLLEPVNKRDMKIIGGGALVAMIGIFVMTMFDRENPFPKDSIRHSVFDAVGKVHKSCFVSCQHKWCKLMASHRGSNYYIGQGENIEAANRQVQECVFTFYHASHFLLYAIFGFLAPKLQVFAIVLFMGILWECIEYVDGKYHDWSDILYNVSGFWVGVLMRHVVSKKKKKRSR